MHMIDKPFAKDECDYTDDFNTQLRPFSETVAYVTYFGDPQSGRDIFWDEEF